MRRLVFDLARSMASSANPMSSRRNRRRDGSAEDTSSSSGLDEECIMGESTGQIVFINSADYVSDVTGTEAVGCMASLTTEDGTDVVLVTQSLRLQHTLEMLYATQRRVTADYEPVPVPFNNEQQRLIAKSRNAEAVDGFKGPFILKAIWTLD
jgi:hypothetical protein